VSGLSVVMGLFRVWKSWRFLVVRSWLWVKAQAAIWMSRIQPARCSGLVCLRCRALVGGVGCSVRRRPARIAAGRCRRVRSRLDVVSSVL
jgi:hypothetical protein